MITYRLQISKDFTLGDLLPVVDYLHDLGVTHLYLSPLLESVPGSSHGYDGLDFAAISKERGGEDAFRALHDKLSSMDRPLRILLDMVPNHLASSTKNPYWYDVLEKGRASTYWPVFDLRLNDGQKIQLPILGDRLEDVLSRGEIKRSDKDGQDSLYYWDMHLPLDSATTGEQDIAKLLQAQHYELVHWNTTKDHLSYRRFFDVTDLIGVRVEDDAIRNLTHRKLFDLAAAYPLIDGFRVDHVDGLADPTAYVQWLSQTMPRVWVEKILAPDEALRPDWPAQGTTGYEFIHRLNQIMVDENGFKAIEDFWRDQVEPAWPDFPAAVAQGKHEVLQTLFPAELKRLVDLTAETEKDRELAAYFWTGVTVGLDVYRIYAYRIPPGPEDRQRIENACARARQRYGIMYEQAEARFLPGLLTPQTDAQFQALHEWQQLSGPVMAKGLEDTAHYRYAPLIALNEVGCEAQLTETGPAAFFNWVNKRGAALPATMNSTSTHDTKRSEDVRARLYALSAMPDQWLDFYSAAVKMTPDGIDRRTRYFFYQTLLSVWPLNHAIDQPFKERMQACMQKSVREAKRETSWLAPDKAYEDRLRGFINATLGNPAFIALTKAFQEKLAPMGALNSLTVHILKLLSPGVPDLYQGTEGWDFSLVDPDNRRPVDYAYNVAMLAETLAFEKANGIRATMDHLLDHWTTGGIKQWLTHRLIRMFRKEAMQPLKMTGQNADRFIACRNSRLLLILPRNAEASSTLRLSAASVEGLNLNVSDGLLTGFHDALTNAALPAADIRRPAKLLQDFPLLIAARP